MQPTIPITYTPKPARDYLLRQAEKHEWLAEQALSGPNVHNSESARHLYLAEQYRQAANA